MAFRKYQSVEKHDALRGEAKKIASKVAHAREQMDDDSLSQAERIKAEEDHRDSSARLARKSTI